MTTPDAYRATLRTPRRSEEADGQRQGPLVVIVPMLPPSQNHMYLLNKDGSRRLSDEAKTFREYAGLEARSTASLTGWRVPTGRLKFTLLLTFGSRRKTDVDNRIKSALDALALALGFDDSRVDEIIVRRVGVEPGRLLCEMILEGL